MIYVAAPFFNEEQIARVEAVKRMLTDLGIKYFSPKDALMFGPGVNAADVFEGNIEALSRTSLLLCITDGKDVGTIFEAGYSFGIGVPILYFWQDPPAGAKFNLMLSESGTVCVGYKGLHAALSDWIEHDEQDFSQELYAGDTVLVLE